MALIIDPHGNTAGPSGAGDVVIESDTARFTADVMEASLDRPVIVDFWAPNCAPCKQLTPLLEKLVRQAGGLVCLVKINVDENQDLAMQLRIQSVPTVYAFVGGRPVDAFVGLQPESQLRTFISRLTKDAKAPLEQALEQAQAALDGGDAATAEHIFRQVLAEDSTNPAAVAGVIRSLLAGGKAAAARQVIASLTPDLLAQATVKAAVTAVDLAEQADASGDQAALQARVDANPDDHEARFDLAGALYAAGRSDAAIEALLEILKRDRTWNDDAARLQLIKIFDALGPTHPLTAASRRRLSSLLFS